MKFLQIIAAFLIFVSCKKTETNAIETKSISISDTLSTARVKVILTLLKNKDFERLSKQVHPDDGIRLSPYGFVDVAKDLKFTNKDFLAQTKSSKKINWGNYNGSGEIINLNFKDYFEKFIYNADFLYAEKLSFNKNLSKGNSKINITEVYKDCVFSESYFAGFDPKLNGLDWTSLRLVFKKIKNKFYLVGIVHDQWTT